VLSASILGYLVFMQFAYPLVHYSFLFWLEFGMLLACAYPITKEIQPPAALDSKVSLALILLLSLPWSWLATSIYRADQSYKTAFFQARYHHFTRSLASFHQALHFTPWCYQYRYRYAYTLIRMARHCRNSRLAETYYRQAVIELEQLRRSYPERYQLWNMLGDLYFFWGNLDKADQSYREAIRLFPNNYNIYYKLAKTEKMRGRLEQAYLAFQAGSRINPHQMNDLRKKDGLSFLPH
jgi:tetratricopeptide (TPR) repeat protein